MRYEIKPETSDNGAACHRHAGCDPRVPAFGAQEYYVNDGENTLALADAYAIGADGSTAKLPERGVYAATASGTQLLGGSEYDDEQPNIPNGIVRVGLAFGSTALDAFHLQIKTGSGLRLRIL